VALLSCRPCVARHPAVAAIHHTGEHAAGAIEIRRRHVVAGVFEGGPRDLEKKPLLRIHRIGLARRDAEEAGIELIEASDEPTPAAIDRARLARRAGELAPIPALAWHLRDAVARRFQVLP
jgi:hypothetical protein